MKVKNFILAGMAVLVLVFGLNLLGCISMTPLTFIETETSREIYVVASELVASKGGKISAGELATGLSNRFSGMTRSYFSGAGVVVSYNNDTYYVNCEYEAALVSTVNANTIVVEVTSVKQVEKTE